MSTGVVVGRFQVDRLHEGHRWLLSEVQRNHDHLLVVLGVAPLPTSARNPLPFATRRRLIQRFYPEATIVPLEDNPSDEQWSRNLDSLIAMTGTGAPYTLYHSRDSFKSHYSGVFQTVGVPDADLGVSGTLARKLLAETPGGSEEFAQGAIWANLNRYPTVYGTVDAAVFDSHPAHDSKLLLIRKEDRGGFMFPGGFNDCSEGDSFSCDEEDAAREVREETGVMVDASDLLYVGSTRVTDWRYAAEEDQIRTRMFWARTNPQEASAGDDAAWAGWEFYDLLTEDHFDPAHRPLFRMLRERVTQ